jgi:hypothetical protein
MSAIAQGENGSEPRHVFICGLQRSGTSVLARNVGRFRNCTSFQNTGAIEDEGQYLQDVYPTNNELGGTGWYGFDERAHLTEKSELLTAENISRLRASWCQYWEKGKAIRIEKTPGNLLMTRFLQAAFPNAYFVVITRHPIAVSLANQRWKKSMASLRMGFEHWLHCHRLFEEDKRYLTYVYELTYEAYISDPGRYHREIAAFIRTEVSDAGLEEVSGSHNKRYFDRWTQLLTKSPFRSYYRYIAKTYEPRFTPCGYSLMAPAGDNKMVLSDAANVPDGIGRFLCAGADLHAFVWRGAHRGSGQIRKAIRKTMPTSVKKTVKQLSQKKSVVSEKPNVA